MGMMLGERSTGHDGISHQVDVPQTPEPSTQIETATAAQLLELMATLAIPQQNLPQLQHLQNQVTELIARESLRAAVASGVADQLGQPPQLPTYVDRYDVAPLSTTVQLANQRLDLGNAAAELADIKSKLIALL